MFSLSFISVFPYPAANLMQDSFTVKNIAFFTFASAGESIQKFPVRVKIPVPSFVLFFFLPEPPSRWLKYSCFVLLKSNVCWINDKYHSCRSNSYFDPLDVCRAKTSVVNMVLSWAIHLWNAAWAATLFFKSSQTPQKPPKNNMGSQCAKCKQQ